METLRLRTPDLIIIAYGTNEVTDTDWSIESYSRLMVGMMKMFKAAAPNASIIVFGPPDRADLPEASAKMPALIEAQRRAAKEVGAAFWCSYDAMGGAGAMDSWITQGLAQGDHVHLSREGYRKIGDLFYDDIKRAYAEWRAHPPSRAPSRNRRAG
jgi:lysophospholipase L1-like esterase